MRVRSDTQRVEHVHAESWSFHGLLAKATWNLQRTHEQPANCPLKLMFSQLSLELMLRASLSNVSPCLLVESSNDSWMNLYVALGNKPLNTKFQPRSIPLKSVLKRIQVIHPKVYSEVGEFCLNHSEQRNSELHSGPSTLNDIKESSWLPSFYIAVRTLLSTMGVNISNVLDNEDVESSNKLVLGFRDKSAEQTIAIVDQKKQEWESKDDVEKESAKFVAEQWAIKQTGRQTDCPACSCVGLLSGEAIGIPKKLIEDRSVIETFESSPTRFECKACELMIVGLSNLLQVGLGERFITMRTYNVSDYYKLQYHFNDVDKNDEQPYV